MIGSFLVGYHQAQMAAETALAKKISVPERVFVQDFIGTIDENALGEIHVLAEAAFDRMVRVTVGPDQARSIDVVPIYPVSRLAMSTIKSLGEKPRCLMPRSEASGVSNSHDDMAHIETMPVGILVFEAGADLPELSHITIGQGRNGPLIDLTGLHIGGAEIIESAVALLAEKDVTLIKDPIVISPHLEGRLIGSDAHYCTLQRFLFWLSLSMLGCGLILMVSAISTSKLDRRKSGANQVKTLGAFPATDPFQPIAGQDEIVDEEAAEQRSSRIATFAASVFQSKNRP